MPRVINRVRLPYHPLLGRNVNHDSESRRYRVTVPEDTPIQTVQWARNVPIFDQDQLGSCTGNAGVGCTGTGLFYQALGGMLSQMPHYAWNEDGAVALYSRATALDDYSGTWPPEDTGSDGLSIAKALKEAGEISGYLWAFTPQEARAALMSGPLITGIRWDNNMFDPDASGRVRPGGGMAGGHEIVVAGYVMAGLKPSSDDQVWFDNSWGDSWGIQRPGEPAPGGSFWMSFGDWSELLADNGDVTQFVASSEPAPAPTPDPEHDAGDKLWAATKHWATVEHHVGDNAKAASAMRAYAKATGRS